MIVPIFFDSRIILLKKKTSPYLALGVGYSFGGGNLDKLVRGEGFYFNPTTGCYFKISNESTVFTSVSYEMQAIIFYPPYNSTNDVRKNSGSIGLNIGLIF
jgi:hypothetical protein